MVMTRGERRVHVRAGITDPDEVHRELEWFRLGNRSVTSHVVERAVALREQLVDGSAVPQSRPPTVAAQ